MCADGAFHPTILALADDLTGALEVGALLQAPVSIRGVPNSIPDRLVIDTETRHLSADAAAAIVHALVAGIRPNFLYKKTDSTLRGHIGAEIAALARQFPDRTIEYLPAYPAMGRTVCGGHLLIEGVPVHETAFGVDARNPVKSSRIADLLTGVHQTTIHDGTEDADLIEVIWLFLEDAPGTIFCGPASVAAALAHHMKIETVQAPTIGQHERVLVLNGSRHPVAQNQVDRLQAHPNWTLLATDCSECDADECVRRNAAGAIAELAAGAYTTLIVIGGDTAMGVVDALGAKMLVPLGEMAPGMPVSLIEDMGALKFMTKAGGFGPPDLLRNLQLASSEGART